MLKLLFYNTGPWVFCGFFFFLTLILLLLQNSLEFENQCVFQRPGVLIHLTQHSLNDRQFALPQEASVTVILRLCYKADEVKAKTNHHYLKKDESSQESQC